MIRRFSAALYGNWASTVRVICLAQLEMWTVERADKLDDKGMVLSAWMGLHFHGTTRSILSGLSKLTTNPDVNASVLN